MKAQPRSREKYITLDRFLQDDHAMVHVVPSRDGVVVPQHLMDQTTVTLKISRLFRGRLTMTETGGIEAELLFSNEYFTCKVPFEAMWAATSASGQMRMWPEDTPDEILASLASPVGQTSTERIARDADLEDKGQPQTRAAGLQVATHDGATPGAADAASEAAPKKPAMSKGRPMLRRVK